MSKYEFFYAAAAWFIGPLVHSNDDERKSKMFGPNSMCKYLICPSPSPMPPMPSLFNFHQFMLANNIFDWLLTCLYKFSYVFSFLLVTFTHTHIRWWYTMNFWLFIIRKISMKSIHHDWMNLVNFFFLTQNIWNFGFFSSFTNWINQMKCVWNRERTRERNRNK